MREKFCTQQRYEIIRPVVVLGHQSATERARETGMHPETVGRLKRRFEQQGMLGLIPDTVEVVPARRRRRVPDEVVEELRRLKGLYDGFGYRELARIILYKFNRRMSHATIQRLWPDLSPLSPQQLPLLDYHSYPERSQARLEVIQLYFQGWRKTSISQFLQVSRPTINEWMGRFEAEDLASLDVDDLTSLEDKSHAPKSPRRKVWLPVMLEIYHLQKRHPDSGRFRIWSLLGRPEIHERTVGRVIALNKRIYPDIPHVSKKRHKKEPQPHPFKASRAHEYWFIDGRMMDFDIEGVRWWSIIVLDGYSRTMLAGAVSASEASWVALTVLFTACQRYGVPQYLISDKGSAYISNVFEAVCTRLGIDHRTITGKDGESYMNLMETHFNIQRRLYDYQFSLCRTPIEFEQAHRHFLELYNSTAHQGLLKDKFEPPIPLHVLGDAKGRLYTTEELERKFSRALFPRTTNRYGCVTLHSYHFYVEAGLPKTKVLLWVYGNELRAVFQNVVLAEYYCRYDVRDRKVKDIQDGRYFPHDDFASDQYTLIPLNPQEALVLYRQPSAPRQARLPFPAQQLWLFELVS
ncbi:MAG: helix-turn-helix domain-containing protein [Candidatus Tectomicrobia bacterium]|nr:helix-turn-helix domain-containing protein [Candidatus Tectomicrobia bacterium]